MNNYAALPFCVQPHGEHTHDFLNFAAGSILFIQLLYDPRSFHIIRTIERIYLESLVDILAVSLYQL